MSIQSTAEPGLAALQADLAALRRDMASLIDNLGSEASSKAQAAAASVDDGARRLYRTVSAEGGKSMDAISRQVEEQPLVALLLAVGIGWIGGRLLSR
jgi:ElaB/YqjD/DUF883 family membrane-anchored ribosome-binding protein